MRTGIFGGTFDPIHKGHLLSAVEIKKAFNFDRIIFIPTGEPPHKIARRVTPSKDRLAMVRVAVSGYEGFEVSDIECNRKSYTYTFDTLTELHKNAAKDEEFYMIIGADTLADIFNWYRSEDVFKLCCFVAMRRPGADDETFASDFKKACDAGARVCLAEIPQYDVSSTQIREMIKNGCGAGEFLPSGVEDYIKKNDLYNTRKMTFEEICEDLKGLLSPRRYEHSVNVAEESARLAQMFGADIEKCRLAGILHDCAKELTAKQYLWLGIENNEECDYDAKQVLLHAEAGAILAKERYGVCDDEVLEAIRCHITGKPEMGIVTQMVFVADYTEKGRVGATYDAVRAKIAEGKLNEAMLEECDSTLMYNIKRGVSQICPQTVRTRNWITKEIKENE